MPCRRTGADDVPPLLICVAGTADSGKSRLVDELREACHGDLTLLKARLSNLAIEPAMIDRLRDANWIEAPDYTSWTESDSRRDRARIQSAVDAAVTADMLLLAINGRQPSDKADVAFAQAWDRWYVEHPRNEVPPALVVLTGVEGPEFGNGWQPPYDWATGHSARETAVRARIDALRPAFPPTFGEFVAVGVTEQRPLRDRRAAPARDRGPAAQGRADRADPPAARGRRPIQGRAARPPARHPGQGPLGQPQGARQGTQDPIHGTLSPDRRGLPDRVRAARSAPDLCRAPLRNPARRMDRRDRRPYGNPD